MAGQLDKHYTMLYYSIPSDNAGQWQLRFFILFYFFTYLLILRLHSEAEPLHKDVQVIHSIKRSFFSYRVNVV